MQQENHKLPRAFAMATNAPLEPIVGDILGISDLLSQDLQLVQQLSSHI